MFDNIIFSSHASWIEPTNASTLCYSRDSIQTQIHSLAIVRLREELSTYTIIFQTYRLHLGRHLQQLKNYSVASILNRVNEV